ncbi:MAG: Biotin transporter BioY [Thermoanaerobacterium thermosaccharolyticum]
MIVHNDKSVFSLKKMTLASMFASITIVMSFISIPLPFSPVPITGQTLALMLSGSLLDPITSFFSMIIYLALGAVGIPVFAGFHGGISILLGPTGGYLFAMPIASFVISLLTRIADTSFFKLILANIIGGILIVYALGVLQLSVVAGLEIKKAVLLGAVPYLFGDFIKVLISSYLSLKLRPVLKKYTEYKN